MTETTPAAYPVWPNLAAMMLDRAATWPDRPMLRWFADSAWHRMDWRFYAGQVAAAARGLRHAGVQPGERIVIASENRPEWSIAEVALLAIGAVPVPAYVTSTVADHAHVLRDSGARAAIVSTPALATRLAQAGPLDLLVQFDAMPAEGARAWRDLLDGQDTDPTGITAMAAAIPPDRLACLIYTSGTGGAPRGVMLPHRSLLANCLGAFDLVRPLDFADELYLSFLPASHSYEHLVGNYFLPSLGIEIAYARGIEHIAADMLAVQPTIMAVVPRILDVIRGRILGHVAREPAWRQRLFHAAMALGRRRVLGQPLGLGGHAADLALERLVRRRVRARFGGRLRAMMSGGARLDPETGIFFRALGIATMQGYGQTEAGPVISALGPHARSVDSVGPPLAGVEVRIAPDGEILVRGDLVMDGYWRLPDETARVIRDGWLHTGDVGVLDAKGELRITDRKRDIIVLSGGENVSPARVEGLLAAQPQIVQAVVFGDGRPALAALVVAAEGCDERAVATAISAVNARLAVAERVRRHALVDAFTIENSLLTASQKIRRHRVLAAHAELVASLAG